MSMNDILMKNAGRMIRSMIGEDQIRTIARDIIKKAIDYKNESIELDTLAGEADAAMLLYEVAGVAHSAIVILDPEERIIRFMNVQTQDQLIDKMLENF